MNKKADVWISAVIYVGIAITILTIVLAAGLPVINRMRDRNIATDTKEILHELDSTIRDVVQEGPGARRTPSIKITRGEFDINQDQETIIWTLANSKFMFSQPGVEVPEGNLIIKTTSSPVEGEYKVEVKLIYTNIDIESVNNRLSGQYNLIVTNEGVDITTNKLKVSIKELTA